MSPSPPLLPGSTLVAHGGFTFELMSEGVSAHHALLESIREDVLLIAAVSRGWDRPADIDHFRRVFKLDSLFQANAIALVWRGGSLVGLASVVYDLPLPDGVIMHVGSLGLLPLAQNRGFPAILFSQLWEVFLGVPRVRTCLDRRRVYVTAITQSPFILAFLSTVSDLYPSLEREVPDPELVEVARMVLGRFDSDVEFHPQTFVLRKECEFFYRQIPYCANRRINSLCDKRLRYEEGDTFIVVGRVMPALVDRFVRATEKAHPELFGALRDGLR